MAKIYDELIFAQLQNSASDLSPASTGLVYFNTTSLFAKVYNGTVWKSLVDMDSVQALTNKDVDGGTASNTSRVTIPKASKATLDGLTRKQATLVYASDQNKFYGDDGSQLKAVGSGTGEKNYIANPDDATGWVASGAGVVVSTVTTAGILPEESKASGIKLLGVSGTDYVRYRFTLDDGDKSKKLKIQFYMKSDAAYVSDDFEVQMWTNTASNYGGSYAQLTVQKDPQIFKNDAGGLVLYTFDADASDYYELRIARVAGTSFIVISGAIVGPGSLSKGAVVSDWQSFTPTITNLGSVTGSNFSYRRVGANLEIIGRFICGTVGVGTQAELVLPAGLHVDTTIITNDLEFNFGLWHQKSSAGSVNIFNTNYSGCLIYIAASGTDRVVFAANTASNTYKQDSPTTILANNFHVDLTVSVPILEWAGSGSLNTLQEDNLTGWTLYTPTYSEAIIDNSTSKVAWRRVGDSIEIHGDLDFTGAGAHVGFTVQLPNGYTIDTSNYNSGLAGSVLGAASHLVAGANLYIGVPDIFSSTTIGFLFSSATTPLTRLFDDTTGGSDTLSFIVKVKVVEFANSQNGLVGFSEVNQFGSGLVKKAGQLLGTNTNDSAASGYVGEYMEQTRASGSALSLTTATPANVTATAITLTPGDWDIEALVGFDGTITGTLLEAAISENSASFTGTALGKSAAQSTALPTSTADTTIALPRVRKSVSTNTIIYLVAEADFTVGSCTVYGTMTARRVR